jgi:aryl-alcohol dehydrogenase-like predicted oxidoreductase
MDYRNLGTSGLKVSRLCLGTMMFGGPTDAKEAGRIIDHAFDNGVTFIDTANNYTQSNSERVVGPAIKARRDQWVLATKVSNKTGPGPNDHGLSRVHIMREIDRSLERLGTDYVDIYYIHHPDPDTPLLETVTAFGDLIRAGKVRYFGLSNLRAWQIAHIAHLCDEHGIPRPVVAQPYYNLLNRAPEVEVLPAAHFFGLGIVPYSPIARGILTGKYKAGEAPDPSSRAGRNDSRLMTAEWRPESLAVADTLRAHAGRKGKSLVEFAFAWVLNNGAVTASIGGPRTFEQWTQYFGALDYPWDGEDEAIVDSLVPPGHPSTPGYTDPKYPVEGRFPVVAAAKAEGARVKAAE